jgi:hypothetical protein
MLRLLMFISIAATAVFSTGCLRYLTHDRSNVLLDNVDIDQSLDISAMELDRNTWGCILAVWAIRDQKITPQQAARISELYFSHIDKITIGFNIWHLTWAIADVYRNGNDAVKAAMQKAYDDAKIRARTKAPHAKKFVNGDTLYMGDAHFLGRAYAHRHVVVPGNKDYVQSARLYIEQKQKRYKGKN